MRLLTEDDLAGALEALNRADPGPVGRMLEISGAPPLRRRDAGLAGLAWIVVSQQVSTASAAAIHRRVQARFPGFERDHLLGASDEDLRGCGLSAPKMRTLRAICQASADGALDLAALEHLDAQAARDALTQVKGIGPWSADIYLLFCLGHPDVWPAGDLALQEAARMALRLRARPDAQRLEKIGERWRPWRAAAARLLWAYYGAARERERTDRSAQDA
ncbi:MAG: DNA-3-methyladenine glycosylase 2 family protein [Beijerinckiaceae bacterium]|nr:DNA-3-methyladenine glycosylase 2 family protein [Beijerinckiaceae bacterium]